jgi:hypothetical protein
MRGLLSRGTAAAVVGVSAVLIAGGGYALAASSNTIKACVAHTNHDIYKHRPCNSGDTKISWNKTGPKGATGPQGVQGPPGPAGQGFTANFSSLVPFSSNETVTVGDWTLRETTGSSFCHVVALVNNSSATGEVSQGDYSSYSGVAGNSSTDIGSTGEGNQVFMAVLDSGASPVFGDIGVEGLASGCLTQGYIEAG